MTASPAPAARGRARQTVAIFLVSLAGLLLEVGYTRIVSYKLWYYYTYLVIGLALLGIGSGGIFVVLFKRLRDDGDRPDHRDLLDLRRDQHRRRLPRHLADPGRHRRRSGTTAPAASFKNLGGPRRHLLRDLRLVHRARDHRLDDPRPRAGGRHRPPLLRRPHRRRPRLPRRDPADHPPRPARRDHALGADLRRSSACVMLPRAVGVLDGHRRGGRRRARARS